MNSAMYPGFFQRQWRAFKGWVAAHRPYVVWPGQRVWVRVRFSEDRLRNGTDIRAGFDALTKGALPEIENKFEEMGVSFDRGLGFSGRDWEWDWSLKGPMEVTFVSSDRTKGANNG